VLDRAVIRAALRRIVQQGAALSTDAGTGVRITRALRDMLEGGRGHLVGPSGNEPTLAQLAPDALLDLCPGATLAHFRQDAVLAACGWRYDGGQLRRNGNQLGYLAANGDRVAVVVTMSGLEAAKQFAAMPQARTDEILRSLRTHVMPGTVPGERAPRSLGVDVRRAVCLPLEALGLDLQALRERSLAANELSARELATRQF
jgi:hypothetical protein